MDGEDASLPGGALDGDAAAVSLRDVLDDGKPKTAAAPLGGASAFIHAVEALE